jgi:hypothetical protein
MASEMRVLSLLALCLLLLGCRIEAPPEKPKVGAWYWHGPVEVTLPQASEAKSAGLDELYVRAGTLTYDGERYQIHLQQEWKQSEPFGVRLVYNADAGALRHIASALGDSSNSNASAEEEGSLIRQIADEIGNAYHEDERLAENAGLTVRGIQLDFDLPQSRLRDYAKLVRKIRERLRGHEFSVTALQSWVGTPEFKELQEATSWTVPQLYEGYLSKGPEKMHLSDFGQLKRTVEKLNESGHSYRIGIPAYSQAYLFDERGQFVTVHRGLTLEQAFKHPAMKFEEHTSNHGEQLVRFLATKAGADGRGKGYQLVYAVTGPETVREFMAALGKLPGEKRQGVILYRWTGDAMPQVWTGLKPGVDVGMNIETEVRRDVAALVDTNGNLRHEVAITLTQHYRDTMSLDPNGLQVDLEWRGVTVSQVRSRRLKSSVTTPALVSKMTLSGPGLEAGEKTVLYVSTEGAGEIVYTQTRKSNSGETYTHQPIRLELK